MSLTTFIRCRVCNQEMAVTGPASHPMPEFPGWHIDEFEFYRPSGAHTCPRHQRKVWVAYCGNVVSVPDQGIEECEWCLAWSGIIIDALADLDEDAVVAELNRAGVRCRGRNEIIGVDPVGEVESDGLMREVVATL